MMDEPGVTSVTQAATLVKLMRVALLLPIVVLLTLLVYRADASARGAADGTPRLALFPGFLLAFVGFMVLRSLGFRGGCNPRKRQALGFRRSFYAVSFAADFPPRRHQESMRRDTRAGMVVKTSPTSPTHSGEP